MAGGNALCAAVIEKRICAVIAQVPFVSGEQAGSTFESIHETFLAERGAIQQGANSTILFTQIFTAVAAPSPNAFIVQDLGEPGISGWSPLLVQAVLTPILARLSDVLNRKLLVVIPPLFAAAGSFIGAKAVDMIMLIAGNVLVGITLATVGVATSIPAEVLPLKYRSVANGVEFLGGTFGAFHLLCSAGLFACYWPKQRPELARKGFNNILWACDHVVCLLYAAGTTLVLMGLAWSSGSYAGRNIHVAVPVALGIVFTLFFGLYGKQRSSNGICAHVFFQSGRKFPLSVFMVFVEGWIYFSAVNTITTQMTFYLAWDSDSLRISIRQLAYFFPTVFTSLVVIWYWTRFKDIKKPLVLSFGLFLAISCTYIGTKPSWGNVQYDLNVLSGIAQAGPLTSILVATQFTAPHAYLSTATGMAFSTRAIRGAFRIAVLYSITNGHISSHYNDAVAEAAMAAGLPIDAVVPLLSIIKEGNVIPGIDATIISSAADAEHAVYAKAYGLAWASIVPFVVIAIVCCALLSDCGALMTEKMEASMEKLPEKLSDEEEA
ncbi:MFS general substrate transporter [Setomelanomma holmii]|uniref:MFS general substrate transporter n=1 Tax=Setomelanomma holmii TaxID=210430 RepID=A0A9P4HMK0_9PLEO|nr:MFS general substrate transporter [Setomelanomma holmii]